MADNDIYIRSAERREYFRIDDDVLLQVRQVDEAEVADIAEHIGDRMPDRFTVAANFAVSSRQMSRLLHGIMADTPDTARCLRMVDQKLNHLARLFVNEAVERGAFTRLHVNLSAGGLVFPSSVSFAPGTLLETRMVLPPSSMGILTVSRVVHCDPRDAAADGCAWLVAVEYVHIREADRDLLVSHIMNRETELLRRQRGEGSEAP
ncbi:MAG: PilZ domain-containing protein [Gammaproteobacteria bacterium]|nr:PilZ domain-containing protein [Gammaproteobacteria bacterium]